MTLITFQDGKVVLRDGKVGTEQDCCCSDDGECPCEEAVFETCPEGYTVTFDIIIVHPDQTTEPGTATVAISKLLANLWTGAAEGGQVSAEIYCFDGRWIIVCAACALVGDDLWFGGVSADVGSVCECPAAGAYNTEYGTVTFA